MKILIGGGSGFIGQRLTQYLLDQGHRIVILSRHKPRIVSPQLEFFEADLLKPELFEQHWFEGVEAVVNLSGKDIFTFWTKKTKKEIWVSRVRINKNLIDFIAKLQQKLRVFVSASAVGYYGDRGETELDETASRGQGFLAELCEAWENEARQAEKLGMRSVQVRTAPVLGKSGGLLRRILRSFQFGFTFIFGSGNQWFSWIHMNDLVRIYHLAVTDESLSGPINACSPYPVRFRDFMNHLREYKKAVFIPFPAWILKLFLQETADVVLCSQKMVPAKLLRINFQFSYPRLRDALREIFS
jgi:uncharacterized protein (TIGR01777 family)